MPESMSFAELRPVRALTRRPIFSLLAVATVATAVAASTAAFVLVDSAFVAPLPYAQPSRLVTVDVISERGFGISISVPNYRDWGSAPSVFEKVGASAGWNVVLSGRGPARVVDVREVLGDFFDVLGVRAARGRVLEARDTDRDSPPTVVLADRFWRELGADPHVVGRTLTLDGRSYTVLGVLPPGVGYPSPEIAAYLPLGALGDDIPWQDRESGFGLRLYARLARGVTVGEAQRALDRIAAEIHDHEGGEVDTPKVRQLADLLLGSLRPPLSMLTAAAALLVLLALTSVVGLLLARVESRRAELAIRAALGAGRADLVRLQIEEAGWLVGLGGIVGIVGAHLLLVGLAGGMRGDLPFFVRERLHVDPAAIVFAASLLAIVLSLVALLPVRALPTADAAGALRGGRSGAGHRSIRLGRNLIVGELAIGAALLVGALLLVSSLDRLERVEKGFDERGVAIGRIQAREGYFARESAWRDYHRRLLEGARALPGVRSASLALLVPLADRSWEMGVVPAGVPADHEHMDSVLFNAVSDDYFRSLGVPLVRGRAIGRQDRADTERVAVVDRSLADRFWPGQDAIGKQVAVGFDFDAHHGAAPVYRTVVGVVENVRHYELQTPSRIEIYVPIAQSGGRWDLSLNLIVRGDGRVTPLLPSIEKLAASVDPEVPITDVAPLAANVDAALAAPRLLGGTISTLGALALLLAGIGTFALASYGVASRRRELGVRQALGATPVMVLLSVLGQGVRWCGAALAVGLPIAAIGARLARSLLFGVSAADVSAYTLTSSVLIVLVLIASLGPALRAMQIEPARVLRDDL